MFHRQAVETPEFRDCGTVISLGGKTNYFSKMPSSSSKSKLEIFQPLAQFCNLTYPSLVSKQINSPSCFIHNTLIAARSRDSRPNSAPHFLHLVLMKFNVKPGCHMFHFVNLESENARLVKFGRRIYTWVFENGVGLSDTQTTLARLYCAWKFKWCAETVRRNSLLRFDSV